MKYLCVRMTHNPKTVQRTAQSHVRSRLSKTRTGQHCRLSTCCDDCKASSHPPQSEKGRTNAPHILARKGKIRPLVSPSGGRACQCFLAQPFVHVLPQRSEKEQSRRIPNRT
eukprot:166396-Amphidinium_carterae.1